MKISRIEVFLLRIPFRKPFRFADYLLEEFESVVVRLEDSDGCSGWGEVFPGNKPLLTPECSSGVFNVLRDCLIPSLGADITIESGDALDKTLSCFKGNRHAKGALDLAYWDLHSKRLGKPLHETLGGIRKDIELGVVFDRYAEIEPFFADVHRAFEEEFKRITLKIRPGWDLQILRLLRNEYPSAKIICDLEGVLNLDQHSEMLYRFDDYAPMLLEQPLSVSEYVGHAMLQDGMRTAIALDESITTLHQAQIAIDLRSADTFCIKPGKVGGITETQRIHEACTAAGLALYCGCDCSSSIGYRSVIAFSALERFILPTDYLRLDEVLAADLGEPLRPVVKPDEKGRRRQVIELWESPGIGFEPDRSMIEKLSIARFSWPRIQ